jgi:hypothetical protein
MIRFVTIVSANYLAFARVLADSVARHAPESSFRVLVVDRRTPDVEAALRTLGLDAIFVEELGLREPETLFYKYDILELNTAVKPTFLKAMFAEGHRDVVYLDPDTCLYGAPEPILRALDAGNIVVTPHADLPVLDGHRPSDVDFLRNGTFNLGFVALRASATRDAFSTGGKRVASPTGSTTPRSGPSSTSAGWIWRPATSRPPGSCATRAAISATGTYTATCSSATRTAGGPSTAARSSSSTSAASATTGQTCSPSTRPATRCDPARRSRRCSRTTANASSQPVTSVCWRCPTGSAA